MVAQFVTEIDGIEDLKGVFILAATNRPDQVDPAVLRPGRFDLTLDVGLPDEGTRARIFDIHTKAMSFEKGIDLNELAQSLEAVSGAQIEAICRQAALSAIRRVIRQDNGATIATPMISHGDLNGAVEEVLRSAKIGRAA